MNSFILIGKVVKEPEFKETNSGKKFSRIFVTEKRSYKNLKEEYDLDTYEVTVWGNNIIENIKVDDLIAIKGRLQSYEFEKDETKYHNVELVGEKISLYHEII